MVVYQGPAPLMGPTALLEFKSAAAVEHKRLFLYLEALCAKSKKSRSTTWLWAVWLS